MRPFFADIYFFTEKRELLANEVHSQKSHLAVITFCLHYILHIELYKIQRESYLANVEIFIEVAKLE